MDASPRPGRRLVFYNPIAGSAWIARRVHRAAAALTAAPHAEAIATVRGEIADQVRTHLAAGDVSSVFAIGGDGTISDVAGALADTGVPLGFIPCGTTNVLAREFGISLWTMAAVRSLIASTQTRPLRTWTVEGRPVVLGAGVGWDARIMWRAHLTLKRRLGRTAIALVGLREAARYEFPVLAVSGTDASGAHVSLRGTSVILANVRYWAGGNPGITTAIPGDDLIDVIVLQRESVLHLLAFWSLMVIPGGRPLTLPGVSAVRLARVRVESVSGAAVEAHLNGDPVAHTPITLEPAGIVNVIVPGELR